MARAAPSGATRPAPGRDGWPRTSRGTWTRAPWCSKPASRPRCRRCCAHEKLIAGLVSDAHVRSRKRDHAGGEERSSAAPAGRLPSQNAEQRRPVIGVIGDGQPGSERERMAAEVGGELARAGVHLVCGGLGGCMEGASRGYKEANGEGICLGILPGTSRDEANPWVDHAIPTGVNSAQGALVAMAVDGAIVLGGGGGTLSEVGLLLRDGKPVVALDGTGGAAELVGGQRLGNVSVRLARGPAEAVRMVLDALRDKHPEKALEVSEG